MTASRREFLRLAAAPPAAVALGALDTGPAGAQALTPTPSCADGSPTPRRTEGPYFKPESPARMSLLEPGLPGTRIAVAGTILSTCCQPVPRAVGDFWQARDSAASDNAGYRPRGHQPA